MKTLYRFMIFGAFSYIYLNSCDNSTSSINPANSKVDELINNKWVLYSLRSEDGIEVQLNQNETYYLVFDADSSIIGWVDCNSISGNYEARDGGYI